MAQASRWEQERWWSVLVWLEERADPETHSYQVHIGDFAKGLGVTDRTLYRYLREMKDAGILSVSAIRTSMESGRSASIYTLNVSVAELREGWDDVINADDVQPLPDPEPRATQDHAELEAEITESMIEAPLGELSDADLDAAWLAGD